MENNENKEQSLTDLLTEVLGTDFDAEKKSALESKLNAYYGSKTVPKAVFNDKNEKLKELRERLKEHSNKQKESSDWQKEINTLTADYEKKLKEKDDAINDYRLIQALKESKVKNPKAVKALLDMSKLEFESEEIKGLEEQIESLKQSESYLFDLPINSLKKGTGFPSNPEQPTNEQKSAKIQVI